MIAHKLSIHEKNFVCTKCELDFKKEYDLKLHISTNHPVNRNDKCDFQAEGQGQVENLKAFLTHLSVKHLSGTKTFKCSDFVYTTRKSTKPRKSKNLSAH